MDQNRKSIRDNKDVKLMMLGVLIGIFGNIVANGVWDWAEISPLNALDIRFPTFVVALIALGAIVFLTNSEYHIFSK